MIAGIIRTISKVILLDFENISGEYSHQGWKYQADKKICKDLFCSRIPAEN